MQTHLLACVYFLALNLFIIVILIRPYLIGDDSLRDGYHIQGRQQAYSSVECQHKDEVTIASDSSFFPVYTLQ